MEHYLKPGDYVLWKWASGYNHGRVLNISSGHAQITSGGRTISCEGSREDPVITIVDHNDTRVLKLASEVEKAE